jgi:hypothetical protein
MNGANGPTARVNSKLHWGRMVATASKTAVVGPKPDSQSLLTRRARLL